MVAALVGVQNSARKPLVQVDTSLPPGWDGTPDETPSTAAELTTALSNVVQNSGIFIIELTAGTTYTGNFVHTNNAGTDWLIIRTSDYASLPAGTRVVAADASKMGTLDTSDTKEVFRVDHGGHHVRLIGVEIKTALAQTALNLIGWDSGGQIPSVQSEVATFVGFDRCYIHSTSTANRARIGIACSCNDFFVIESRIENIKDTADAQAILLQATDGPIHIENNYLEATGENILSGGNDNLIFNQIPSDITILRNHMPKRNEWDLNHADYGGINWGNKNIFELKMARRVHFHSNVLEHNWVDNQNGTAILLTVRNQNGGNRWARIEDVTIENNVVKRTGRLFNFLAEDNNFLSSQLKRVRIRNNLVHTHGGSTLGGTEDFGTTGRAFNIGTKTNGRPAVDLYFDHNTFVFQEGHLGNNHIQVATTGLAIIKGMKLTNNIWDDGNFNTWLTKVGTELIDVTISGNGIFFNPSANNYANRLTNFGTDYPGNVKADTIALAKFTDNANQDYTLQGGGSPSPFKGAADDGKDCGVDFKELNAAIAGVEVE